MNKFELDVGRWYWAMGLGLVRLQQAVEATSADAQVEDLVGRPTRIMVGAMRMIAPRDVDHQELTARVKDGWEETHATLFWRVRRDNGFGSEVFREPT